MKTSIKKMKLELKELASKIKYQKSIRKLYHPKHAEYIGDWGVKSLSYTFRHKHVAYCLARGRTLEQVDSSKGLSIDWVNWILDSMNPASEKKLYVIVNEKLSVSQQAVQAGHAVAEFLKVNPNTQWSNGHLIYLKDAPSYDGNMRCYYSLTGGVHQYAEFKEPDIGNKVTAYACFGPEAERLMGNKKLL